MQSHETRTSTTERRALIIASNQAMTMSLRRVLEQAEWQVEIGRDQDEFNLLAEQATWLLVIMVCERGSSEMLKILQSLQPAITSETTSAIVIAEQLSISDAILCTRNGALDYLSWPVIPSQLLEIAERAYRLADYAVLKSLGQTTDQAKSENARAAPNQSGRAMIGSSIAMIEMSKQIVRLESDLFGHEKGAFTGAHATKKGLWEEAASGTLFLDEITETSPTVQAKLLRVLQEGVIRRVGSNREIKVSARVIAASNRDIEQAVREGTFRRDLYYRFGQVLRLPPLRERLEDIPLLVAHFCQRTEREIIVTDEAMELLCAYEWPGNVRELESVIQQLLSFSGRFVFREDVLRHINVSSPQQQKVNLPFWSAMNSLRRDEWPTIRDMRNWYVTQAFLYFGQESVVARYLGMDARTVSTILEEVADSNESLRGVIDSRDKE